MDGTVRVLAVDDEPDLADLTGTFLERNDERFAVTTATSADEGLTLLERESFDCVVSDYDMPGRNGIEFLRSVRAAHPELPFILFTGKGSEEVASDAISAGVTDYLQKETGSDQYAVLANRVANAVEHYRTQRMVERSKQRLRRIIDAIPHPLYVVDRTGAYLLANEALATFHDTSVAEIEGSHVEQVLGEAAAEQFMTDVEAVLERGEVSRFPSAELEAPDGEFHVFEPRVLPYEFAADSDRAVLGIATDVTERVQRERQLNELVDRLEALHESTRRLVRVEDRRAVAGVLTDAVRDSFEYARSVVRLREDDRLHPVAVTASVRREVDDRTSYGLDEGLPGQAFQSGETIVVDDRREGTVESPRTRDGDDEPFPHRSAMYLPIGDHGTLTIGHPEPGVFDAADRSLARVLVDNAATVLDRLDGAAERRRQNDRLETLVDVVSHDLRNSLDVAQARVDLLAGDADDDHLDAVVRAHDRMERLIEDMLALTRVGADVTDPAAVDLAAVAEHRWAAVDAPDAELVVDSERTVQADERRLGRLLENCFRNAVEHGSTSPEQAPDAVEHGGSAVTVTVGDLPDGFYVADDGDGVAAADRERIFETGHSTRDGGTGFGLSIVEAIAEAHGWSVGVTAGPDGGARFEFTGVGFAE